MGREICAEEGEQMEGIDQNPWISLLRRKRRVDGSKAGLEEQGSVNNQRKPDSAPGGELKTIRRQRGHN